jgi:hypothetical protein
VPQASKWEVDPSLTPWRIPQGDYSYYSSIDFFWKRNIPKFYPLFNNETDAINDEFFNKLKEEEIRHTKGSSKPSAATSAPKKVMSTMRIVNMSRPREATEEDTLAMYRVSYLNSSGMKHTGWQQFDPGSMITMMRKEIAESMGFRIVPREVPLEIYGIAPEGVTPSWTTC